ncbi:unnamed protein product [Closterium sp. NIES-54]
MSSMFGDAVEELATGGVSVVGVPAAADVVSATADVVSATADVVSAAAECCIVANARVRSASGMDVKVTIPSLSAVPKSGTKSRTKTLFFKTALPM